MKCKQVLQRMLATSGPRKLSSDVLDHIDQCGRCHRIHERLVEIDRSVSQLPVPSSAAAKAAFVQRMLFEPTTVRPRRRVRISWVHVVTGVAAALLLALLASGVLNRERTKSMTPLGADEFLAEMLDRGMIMATAGTPKQRVEELAILADRLDQRTRQLARVADPNDLSELANLYKHVLQGDKGLIARTELIEADRMKVLDPIADRLLRASQDVEKLSREVPPGAVDSLQVMAKAARDAHQAIRQKAREDKLAHGRLPTSGVKS